MPVLSREIAKRIKGALAEREDWWRLCYDTDSDEFFIEHEWSYTNAYKTNSSNEGTKRHAVDGWDGPGKENLAEAKTALTEEAQTLSS